MAISLSSIKKCPTWCTAHICKCAGYMKMASTNERTLLHLQRVSEPEKYPLPNTMHSIYMQMFWVHKDGLSQWKNPFPFASSLKTQNLSLTLYVSNKYMICTLTDCEPQQLVNLFLWYYFILTSWKAWVLKH